MLKVKAACMYAGTPVGLATDADDTSSIRSSSSMVCLCLCLAVVLTRFSPLVGGKAPHHLPHLP